MAACGRTTTRKLQELGVFILVAAAASLPYSNSLNGKYCYDDKVAVAGNPDVYKSEVPFSELITHDFWGNDMLSRRKYGWTHHSWRPLVVLSFRWDHWMGGGDPFPFHVSNVLYHALSAVTAYCTYRLLLPSTREIPSSPSMGAGISKAFAVSSRALLAAVLFALHPVHSECVANITSRADAVASIFQLAAVALYVAASGPIVSELRDAIEEARWRRRRTKEEAAAKADDHAGCGPILKRIFSPCLRPSTFTRPANAEGHSWVGVKWLVAAVGYCLLLLVSLACKETSLVVPFLCVCYDIAIAMARSAVSYAADIDNNENDDGANAKRPQRGWCRLSLAYLRRLVFFEMPWLKAALVFAFGYLVYYVRIVIVAKGYTLAEWVNPIHNSLYHTKDRLERVLSIALVQAFALSKLVFPLYLNNDHGAIKHVKGFFEARNALTVLIWTCLAGVAALAFWCLKRAMMYRPLPAATAVSAKAAQTTETSTVSRSGTLSRSEASSNQLGPAFVEKREPEEEDIDTETLLPLSRAFSLLFGLAWVAVSYFPSSHAVQYVAFIIAERTLYLPSFGACLILAELLTMLAGHPLAGSADGATSRAILATEQPSTGLKSSVGKRARLAQADTGSKPVTHRQSSAEGEEKPRSGLRSLRLQLVGSRRRTLATLLTSLLLSWYVVRTYTRNWDWANEETLMRANLQHYPAADNAMTVWAMGAEALAKGEIDKAERYLVRACNQSTLVEPHILLSQLYWKYRTATRPDALAIAQSELEWVAASSSPRKEVLTNLGLLMYSKANSSDTETLKQAEYYVLAAAVAHGYPEGHRSIAQLASNAGCMRLMSHKDRYGDAGFAERFMNEALVLARRNGGTATAFKNAATFYAVQGNAARALSILEEGIAHLQQESARALAMQSTDGNASPSQKATLAQFYQELLQSMQRQGATIQRRSSLLASWAASGSPVVGEEATPRMAMLGVTCVMELLWW